MKLGFGTAFALFGLCAILAGRSLLKRFSAEVNYSGIGGFRFSRGGLLWFLGYLLVIFGSSLLFVGMMLLFV